MKKQYSTRNLVVTTKFTRFPNEVLEKLCCFEHGQAALRVLLFIIRKTYGFSKTTDCLSLKQIEEGTKLSNRTICRAMLLLNGEGYITTSKAKDFRKHIPNNITIVIGRAGVRDENAKRVDHSNEVEEFLTADSNDYSDLEDGKATDMEDSRTPDMQDSSLMPKTTVMGVSTTTVPDGVHKRDCKEIEEEEKIQRKKNSPLGFPTRKPRGKSLRDSSLDESSSSCEKSSTKEVKPQSIPKRNPEQLKLIEDNFKLIARTPYLRDLVKRGKPIEQWQLNAVRKNEEEGNPYKRKIGMNLISSNSRLG